MVWLTDERCLCLISSRDHCQRFSPSQISDTPRAGFEPAQNLSSDFVEGSCAVAITTKPRRHRLQKNSQLILSINTSSDKGQIIPVKKAMGAQRNEDNMKCKDMLRF